MRTHSIKRAFTLIEILIVVVILGILAAIVIPQFTDASADAMDASVRAQLQTIRGQIELYNVQNPDPGFGLYDINTPLGAAFWDGLVNNDYLQQSPRNPLSPVPERILVGAVPGAFGWVWDGSDFTATDGLGGAFLE